jgi:hypothetical protein
VCAAAKHCCWGSRVHVPAATDSVHAGRKGVQASKVIYAWADNCWQATVP